MGVVTQEEIGRWLDSLDVKWTYIDEYPIDKIDVVRSLSNQARLEPLNDEVVERYAADVEAGDQFPPLLLRDVDGVAVLIGGNHRTAAFRRVGKATHSAFVVDGGDDVLAALRYEDNRRHGLPPTTDERCLHGIHLMDRFGHSQSAAARTVGVPQTTLSRFMAAQKCVERAKRVPGVAELPVGLRFRLDMIEDDAVLAYAAKVTVERRLTAAAVTRIVDAVKYIPSLDLAKRTIAEVAEAHRGETRTAGKPERSDLRRLEIALSTIAHLNTSACVRDLRTPNHRLQLAGQVSKALRKLQSIEAQAERKAPT